MFISPDAYFSGISIFMVPLILREHVTSREPNVNLVMAHSLKREQFFVN